MLGDALAHSSEIKDKKSKLQYKKQKPSSFRSLTSDLFLLCHFAF